MSTLIREATPEDIPQILELIRLLAEYEREPDAVEATEEGLRRLFFGENPAVFAHVIDDPEAESGRLAGMAIWFLNFSTWTGRHGIWLEDLYVREELRGRGYGLALMRHLAKICVQRGYGRLEWTALDWNAPALGFYQSLGAVRMEEWTTLRLSGQALKDQAK